MTFIPEPFVGFVQLFFRMDARYGPQDPIQWPQIFTTGFEYLCCIRRRLVDEFLYQAAWSTPDELIDFQTIEGSAFTTLGLLRPLYIRKMTDLVDPILRESEEYIKTHHILDDRLQRLRVDLRQARERILSFPVTFRDICIQVRAVQRYFLMTRAYMDYHDATERRQPGEQRSTNSRLMGAFTTDPVVVQRLFAAGIPVWFIRPDVSILDDTTVRNVVLLDRPRHIIHDHWVSNQRSLCSGLFGPEHLRVQLRRAITYSDICHEPLLVCYDTETYAAHGGSNEAGVGPTRPRKQGHVAIPRKFSSCKS